MIILLCFYTGMSWLAGSQLTCSTRTHCAMAMSVTHSPDTGRDIESSLCSLHKAIVWADLFLFTVRLQAKHKCTVSAVLVHGRQNVRVGLWLVRLLLYFYVIISCVLECNVRISAFFLSGLQDSQW